jgi:5-oxopent-3-ene-1,2,5-tricarboxylate decarboxylase/2-hydroxyhepta-2,4-diene-1,7-dioate isomerase
MKTARVAYGGAIHTAYEHPQGLKLADGRIVAEDAVVWLPPFEVGTIIALGLNYADHVKELAKELTITTKDEPLVFLKGPGAVIGHRGQTRRPADVTFMHYECELAVVIGRTAKGVNAADAMQYVAGYTVFIDAADVADPNELTLNTYVNGQRTQHGSTRDFVNDIPSLIEYLSEFMTLQAGDVILTGTPEGVVNVNVGDEVITEVEGIGRLVNTIVGDDLFGR